MPNFSEWVSKLVGRRLGGADEPAPEEALGFNPEDVRPTTWNDDLDLSLGRLVTETETKASGRLQVLTLAHLRAELGDGWDRYKDRVLLIAETTIGRMIGRGNTFIPQDEDSWLLLMPSLSEHEAELRADEMARVLGEKLVGARFEEKEPPLPQTAKVDLGAALNDDGSFNTGAMKAAVKRARLVLAAKDARRPSQELDKSKSAKAPVFATTASYAQASLFPRLSMIYRPQWVAETESFAVYVMRAFTDTAEPVFGPSAPPQIQAALNDATIIDLAKAAFADFTGMAQRGLRATYVLPVPFAVMTRKLGAVFMRALAALPQKERLMHMRIELVNVPIGANVQALIDVREVFRGRVKDVAFLMDLDALNDAVLALDHVALGVEMRTDSAVPDAELGGHLAAFRRRAGSRRSYVMGLRSRGHVALAVQCGLDEISGPGLVDDVRHLPDRATVAYRQDLLRGG
jgi:hypothetical protein